MKKLNVKTVLEKIKNMDDYEVIIVVDENAKSIFPQELITLGDEVYLKDGIEYLAKNKKLLNAKVIEYDFDFGEVYMQIENY